MSVFNVKKTTAVILLIFFFSGYCNAQTNHSPIIQSDSLYQAEVSCGTCLFKMKGEGCKLAVRIKEKCYFIEGRGIDDFGDAHAEDGFCNAIRSASVKGEVVKDVFVAREILLNKQR